MKTSTVTALKLLSEMSFFEMREEAIKRKLKHNGVKKEALIDSIQKARDAEGIPSVKKTSDQKKYVAVPDKLMGLMGAKAIDKRPSLSEKSIKDISKPKVIGSRRSNHIALEAKDFQNILNLECKKNVKIYKLHKLGYSNRQIAELLETNAGHVRNEVISYNENPSKVEFADSFIC